MAEKTNEITTTQATLSTQEQPTADRSDNADIMKPQGVTYNEQYTRFWAKNSLK